MGSQKPEAACPLFLEKTRASRTQSPRAGVPKVGVPPPRGSQDTEGGREMLSKKQIQFKNNLKWNIEPIIV